MHALEACKYKGPGKCLSQTLVFRHGIRSFAYPVKPNGGVTPNRSIYNIRASQQELTVHEFGHSGIQGLRLIRVIA